MMYIGNGIYSDVGGPDTLIHYGVLGMKWGVRKARIHERNLYRHNRGNGMSRAEAKDLYKKRMAGVKSYARANRGTGMRARDIATNSYNEANKKISNYDAKLKAQKRRKIIAGALGAAAIGAGAYGAYKYNKGKKLHASGTAWLNQAERRHNSQRKFFNDVERWATSSPENRQRFLANSDKFKNNMVDYAKETARMAVKGNNERAKGGRMKELGGASLYSAAAAGGAAGAVALANHIKTRNQMRQGNDTSKGSKRKKR